jgi:glycosyltransferase involved in cell wall biosynthesis
LNIGVLTRYDRAGASSRVRFLQFGPELEARGFLFHHEPLFTSEYINCLQLGQVNHAWALRALLRRMKALRAARRFDVLWVEKDTLPWLPAALELALIPRDIPLVLDYDDAVFHQYDMHANGVIRWLLGTKHQSLMRRASLVVAGNNYIADYAARAGAHKVMLLPSVVDLDRYSLANRNPSLDKDTTPTVGWIGQRSTASFLQPLAQTIKKLSNENLMQFRAIGINAQELGLNMASESWSEKSEVTSIRCLDVGIMPLQDGPFERGKCGYKLIQYMACGLPVVASPVGVNETIVEHGVNGFLATTLQEWEQALRMLAKDPALRRRMGEAGRAKVEREYCLQVAAPRLAGWLNEVANSKGG